MEQRDHQPEQSETQAIGQSLMMRWAGSADEAGARRLLAEVRSRPDSSESLPVERCEARDAEASLFGRCAHALGLSPLELRALIDEPSADSRRALAILDSIAQGQAPPAGRDAQRQGSVWIRGAGPQAGRSAGE